MPMELYAYLKGSSVGSATTVANRDTRQRSVGVAGKTPCSNRCCLPSRRPQDQRGSRKTIKKVSLSLYRVLWVICRVIWQESHNFLKVPIVCHHLARGNWTGMKNRRSNKKKTKGPQIGAWYYRRFDRGVIVYMCIVTFRALHIMSVFVAAKHTANAVAQDCKVLSHPSKCVLVFGCKCQS